MGFFKKLFNDVNDVIKKSEEKKQNVMAGFTNSTSNSRDDDSSDKIVTNDDQPSKKDAMDARAYIDQLREELKQAIHNKMNSTEAYATYVRLWQQYICARNLYLSGERSVEKIKEAIQQNLDTAAGKSNDSASQSTANKEIKDNGMFSARMEALISASLQDGVLTEQEKAVLKKRAEKEGEDWDEVEMIIEARLAEMQSALPAAQATLAQATAEKDNTEEDCAEKTPSLLQTEQTDIPSTQETVIETSNESDGTGLIVRENGETEILNADLEEIFEEQFNQFYQCSYIVKVILPSGIKRIGKKAFKESGLKEVDFSRCSKLEIIEEYAFWDCTNLKVVDLSGCAKLKVIDEYAFYQSYGHKNSLRKVIFPASIKSIGKFAFHECSNLEEIDFSQCMQLESIGDWSFSKSQLKQVILPASLKKINRFSFSDCEKLEILDFSSCTQLEYVDKDIVSDTKNIKVLDFSNCEKLNLSPLDIHKDFEKIILPPGQKSFNAMCIWDQFGYNIDKSLCHFQYIPKGAFSEMEEITEMEIPDSVEEIGKNAFEECRQLKTLIMPASLKKIESLGDQLERLKKLDFSKVTQLKKIPEKIVNWGCYKLRELTIPNGVVEIEDDAFSEMSSLRTLFLPPTLEEIGELGFNKLDIYCFSPAIEELTPLVVTIDNEEDILELLDEEEEGDEEKERMDSKSYRINLFVLPQYLEKYIAQRNAERISKDVLVIQAIPDEYLYFYDN